MGVDCILLAQPKDKWQDPGNKATKPKDFMIINLLLKYSAPWS
jgi:hypothetical protein